MSNRQPPGFGLVFTDTLLREDNGSGQILKTKCIECLTRVVDSCSGISYSGSRFTELCCASTKPFMMTVYHCMI